MKKIAVIPIDNRPVCYELVKQITKIDEEIELYLPDRNLLGNLVNNADIDRILEWADSLQNIDYFMISLDTIAYGGLISSRRSTDTYECIFKRIERFTNIIKNLNCKTYAFSSIMRISNNNINEEEKEYWNKYGKKIFDYSFNLHKAKILNEYDNQCKFTCIEKTIPSDILEDYLTTRARNFEINKLYINLLQKGVFDFLVFSKDDCAQYGINVEEAQTLEKLIAKEGLNAQVKTGADEIPLCLLSRAITNNNPSIKIAPIFLNPKYTSKISKYEDITVKQSVENQINLCGGIISKEEDADILLYVNNFIEEQGEIVMNVNAQGFQGEFIPPTRPYMIADVAFANGADNNFTKQLFQKPFDMNFFFGYSAWNTTANTLGSLIATACTKLLAKKLNSENFKKSQYTRLLDDYAYQANIRQIIKSNNQDVSTASIAELMQPYETTCQNLLGLPQIETTYKFPWNRLFEIEIII